MLINPVYAQEVVASTTTAMAPAAAADPLRLLFQFLVIFVIFYFFLIRPQQKKVKEHQVMQMGISRGDTIVTYGGIVGKVIRSNPDDLLVEIADGVRVVVVRDRVLDRHTPASETVAEKESANDDGKKGSAGLKDVLTKK